MSTLLPGCGHSFPVRSEVKSNLGKTMDSPSSYRPILTSLLFLFLLWFSMMGCGKNVENDKGWNLNDLQSKLQAEISSSGAEVGVALKDLESGQTLLINADQIMHAASTMKVPVMIEAFRQAEAGKLVLDDSILVKNEFRSIVDGSVYSMDIGEDSDEILYKRIGRKATVRELIYHMITVSSNLATNILIELVDAKEIMSLLEGMEAQNMTVLRGVEDMKAYNRKLNNMTSAKDLMIVMEGLARETAGTKEHCRQMIDILSDQQFRDKIPAGVPSHVRVANKTGWITQIDHDAAIIFPAGRQPYVLAILTRGLQDHEAAIELIARLSGIIYTTVVGEPAEGLSR